MGEIVWGASGTQVRIYYLLVLLTFIYLLYKNHKHRFSILVILLFFNGLFAFYGKNLQNAYRISLVILTFYWIVRTNAFKNLNTSSVLFSFIFFSITFLYTAYVNGDYFFIIFSQYSRYFILFSIFYILRKLSLNTQFRQWIETLVYEIIIIQILLTVAKFIIIHPTESIVGSVASQGGAIATILPMLGFMFIWLRKKGIFENIDWAIVLGLAFIGFVSLKRALWFIMPVLIALFMFYIPRRKIPAKVTMYSLLAVPLVFYLGVRLNSTLNREGRIGGSFDVNYAVNYAQNYMFGEEENRQQGQGRGGATLFVFDKLLNGDSNEKDWYGYGLRFMYATDYSEFDELRFGISTKGAATGVFQTMITNGYLGIFATLWFIFSILFQTRNKRLLYVLIGVFCWEYFFYTGMIIREPALSFLLIYIVLASPAKSSEAEDKNQLLRV